MKHLCAALTLAVCLTAGGFGQLSQSGGPTPQVQCNSRAFVEISSSTTAQVIAGQAAKSIYVCGFLLNSGGVVNARLVEGTGTNCATSPTNLTPAFKLTNGASVRFGSTVGAVLKVPAGHSLCLSSNANPDLNVLVTYAQF